MTARGIPENPQFATESEREVWQRAHRKGNDDWMVLANVRLTDEKKDHEVDLIVLMPDVGVVVAEVKGGSVFVEDGAVAATDVTARPGPSIPSTRRGTAKYALRTLH